VSGMQPRVLQRALLLGKGCMQKPPGLVLQDPYCHED
jgi:hypothetical protein